MPVTTAQKLKIKPGYVLRLQNAPPEFETNLGELPAGVSLSKTEKKFNQLHWFVRTKADVDDSAEAVLAQIQGDSVCWIYFPKGSSKIQTDLTRDKGWDTLLQRQEEWKRLSLISFDDTWSAFGFRRATEADKREAAKPKDRPIFDYVDPLKKSVRLPDDFQKALNTSKAGTSLFEMLSFTNKKEYLEWIVTAKREETRQLRVAQSIERLEKGWKNPANR